MRFSELKIGDHFFFEGLEYTKTSPMLANDPNGKSRIIPRSADLHSDSTQTAQTTRTEDSELDRLYHAITAIIRQEVHDSDLEVRLRHTIEKVWRSIKSDAD